MSVSFCAGCGKRHEDYSWKNTTYNFEDGQRTGWFCTRFFKPSKSREWVPDSLKQDRIKYAPDTVQPFRGGKASREFLERYPEQAKKTFTPKEMKSAKNVWKGDLKGL